MIVAAVVAWGARGLHDEAPMDEGVFLVVNAGVTSRTIELRFPSGERRSAGVEAGQAVELQLADSGEGAVSVMSDSELVESVGYVASWNGLSVVVVEPDRVLFSQDLRSEELVR